MLFVHIKTRFRILKPDYKGFIHNIDDERDDYDGFIHITDDEKLKIYVLVICPHGFLYSLNKLAYDIIWVISETSNT